MISIAMTTYNGEKYLKEQLDSILNQTYTDYELIICDDCSSDSTIAILKDYAVKDNRIKVFYNEMNLGFKKNFQKAISICRGDYVALCDQDDIWTPDHLEILLGNIGDNYVICGNNLLVDEKGLSTNISFFESNIFDPKIYKTNEDILNKIFFSGSCFQGASMLIKRTYLSTILPIPETVEYHDLWFASLACSQNKFCYTTDIVTHYRQHARQITRNKRKNNSFSANRLLLLKELSIRISHTPSSFSLYKTFHENQNLFIKRIKVLSIWLDYYSFIYPQKKCFFILFLKYLIKGVH